MSKTRPPYPPEFRREAIRLLRSGGRSPRQLAGELGCSEQTLSNWLRQEEADRGERSLVRELGVHHLRGVGAETLYQVVVPDLRSDFPALRTIALA